MKWSSLRNKCLQMTLSHYNMGSMNEFSTAELKAMKFAVTFTYWLHKATTFALGNTERDSLVSKLSREIEKRMEVEAC